jgi:hypothetical protein
VWWGWGKCCKKLFIFSGPVAHQLITLMASM